MTEDQLSFFDKVRIVLSALLELLPYILLFIAGIIIGFWSGSR